MYLGFPIFIIPHSGGKVKGFSEFFRILQRETVDTDSIGFYFLQKGARRMTFSSLIFLFAFLPLTLAAYYLFPRGWRNAVLLAAGLLFCAWDRPASLLPLLWETLAAYCFARLFARSGRRVWLWGGIACVTAPLLLFKYTPFGSSYGLPQGISFYTFALLSYLADVSRGRAEAERNPLLFGTYATLFPLLGAGPILRWSETRGQLTERRESLMAFGVGVGRFCCGLGKKLLLGDGLAAGYRYYRDLLTGQPTVLGAWMTLICFTLHLYFDFSGYTDMALGVGRMFGFRFPENFDYPFLARSVTDFWRRWHLSLSRWFRDYVYIPLGGNRRGRLIQCRNLAAVWLLTGVWHGAGWNFLLWGGYFCVILICEHLFLRRFLERLPSFPAHLYALFLILVSFLLFSYRDWAGGWQCFCALFGVGTVGVTSAVTSWQALRLLPLLAIAVFGSTPLPRRIWGRFAYRVPVALPIGAVLLTVLCVAYLLDASFLPFAYLNF